MRIFFGSATGSENVQICLMRQQKSTRPKKDRVNQDQNLNRNKTEALSNGSDFHSHKSEKESCLLSHHPTCSIPNSKLLKTPIFF